METAPIAHKPGFYLVSSLDIADVRPGLEMVKTAAILRQSTLLVVGRSGWGPPFEDDVFGPLGTKLKDMPSAEYVDAYKKTPVTDEVRQLANEAIKQAKAVKEVTEEDIVNAAKHYSVSKRLLAEHGQLDLAAADPLDPGREFQATAVE